MTAGTQALDYKTPVARLADVPLADRWRLAAGPRQSRLAAVSGREPRTPPVRGSSSCAASCARPGGQPGVTFGRGGEYPPRRTITADLGDALRQARLARGWSVRRAAARIGCAHGTVVHLEAARRAPSVIMAEAILDAYGDALDDDTADELLAQAVDDAGRTWHGPNVTRGARHRSPDPW